MFLHWALFGYYPIGGYHGPGEKKKVRSGWVVALTPDAGRVSPISSWSCFLRLSAPATLLVTAEDPVNTCIAWLSPCADI
jgi:hypothetical protein